MSQAVFVFVFVLVLLERGGGYRYLFLLVGFRDGRLLSLRRGLRALQGALLGLVGLLG